MSKCLNVGEYLYDKEGNKIAYIKKTRFELCEKNTEGMMYTYILESIEKCINFEGISKC